MKRSAKDSAPSLRVGATFTTERSLRHHASIQCTSAVLVSFQLLNAVATCFGELFQLTVAHGPNLSTVGSLHIVAPVQCIKERFGRFVSDTVALQPVDVRVVGTCRLQVRASMALRKGSEQC